MKRETENVKREDYVSRFTFYDGLLALVAAVFASALYLRTLSPGILGGDSGEFQFAGWLGGFAHPTGYPLYLMLGWLWTHLLPLRDPAWRMNAFSALWGGVAAGLLYLLAARVLVQVNGMRFRTGNTDPWHRWLAFFAALSFTVTPTFWSQAVIAEVYTLNAAFVAAILLGLVTWGQSGSRPVLYVTALLYGLSLAHHRTMLLCLPASIIYAWMIVRTQGQDGHWAKRRHESPRVLRTLATLAVLILTPMLLYAYIPLRAPHVPYFKVVVGPDQVLQLYRPTLGGFIEHISGQGFGSALGTGGVAGPRLKGLPALFLGELTIVGLALGLLGLVWLAWRSRPLLALTGLSFLAIIGFNLVYGIGDIFAYYIPAYLIWVLWMAVGVKACASAVTWLFRRRDERAGGRMEGDANQPVTHHVSRFTHHVSRTTHYLVSLSTCLLAFILPVYLLLVHYAQLDRSRNVTAPAWDALLAQPIPQDAILVTNDRDEMMPQWYLKYVEGRRADLTGLFPLIQPGPAWADVGAVTDQALRSGRPVYLIKPMDGMQVKFDLVPEGSLVRVNGPAGVAPPSQPTDVSYGGAVRLAGYDIKPGTLGPGGAADITLLWQPITRLDADYTVFVHLVNADGVKIAQSDHQPGGVFYPTTLWKPSETLIDEHVLALPGDPGRAPYTIVVGLYDPAADMRHLGEPQQVGTVGP